MAPSAHRKAEGQQISGTWADIIAAWSSIELDFQDSTVYGIDLESGILDQRSWRWLALRIAGLISSENSRLYRALTRPHVSDAADPRADSATAEEESSHST